MSALAQKLAFFRQTGWMVVATTAGGLLMWLVHVPAAAKLPTAEYGVMLALLQVTNLMLIPAVGLQTIVAQQTAAAIHPPQQRQLAHTLRVLLTGVSLVWLVMVAGVFGFRHGLVSGLQIRNPAALWVTVSIGLAMLWWPILSGVLQGRQNFLWLGCLQVANGAGRLLGILVIVVLLGGHAAGAMTAALLGYWLAVGLGAWQTHTWWCARGEPVHWRGWLARVIPLTLGLSASQFTMAIDQIVVQSIFHRDVTALYGAAGTIGRALMFFTGAVFAVMFPKVVASQARAESSDVLALALGATAGLGGLAALACTLVPEFPLRIVYATRPEYWTVAPLVPWFAWCMLPLTLANVLVGNLLARERFQAVPWLLVTAAAYGATLLWRAPTFQALDQAAAFKAVVQNLGLFSLLLLAVAGWFTWGHRQPVNRRPDRADG